MSSGLFQLVPVVVVSNLFLFFVEIIFINSYPLLTILIRGDRLYKYCTGDGVGSGAVSAQSSEMEVGACGTGVKVGVTVVVGVAVAVAGGCCVVCVVVGAVVVVGPCCYCR